MDPNKRILDRPRSLRFFCNGNPFYLGQWIFVSRKRYPTLDRLLGDLSRKLNEVVNLPYGVRQIFMVDGGVRVNSIERLLEGDQREFVCAGFETFRPLQYGHKNVERWRAGKHSMTSLSSKINSVQKIVKTRILSESQANVDKVNSRNSRIETNCSITTKSKLSSNYSGNLNKNSVENSNTTKTSETNNRVILKSTNGIEKRWGHNFSKDRRYIAPNIREKIPKNANSTEECTVLSLKKELSILDEPMHRDSFRQRVSAAERLQTIPSDAVTVVTNSSGHDNTYNKTRNCFAGELVIVEPRFLSERFEMGKVLGEGNFAVVRQCRLRATDQEYAVKIIEKRKLKKRTKIIDNELKILKQCQHSNIVRLLDVYETRTDVYLVMELVKGGDLFDAIRCRRKFPEHEASCMIEHLAHALSYLHRRNIVHRDIKPENILVQRNSDGNIDCLKLADFGLAVTATRQLFKLCGTPIYVAPEMLADVGYRSEVDLWSMGIILYILLCGYPPFRISGGSDAELFDLIQSGDFVFDSPHWDHATEEAMDLIQCLLEKKIQKRFNASEVLNHPWIMKKGSTSSSSSFQ